MSRVELEARSSIVGYKHTTFQRRLNIREERAGIRVSLDRVLFPPLSRAEKYARLEEMVGNTPLLLVDSRSGSQILAKVESQNPTESHYDRAFLATLKRLERDGIIKPGDELLEVTSGNAGTAFAWLCNRLGYKARIIVPPTLPTGRVQEMISFGAAIEKPAEGYMPEAVDALTQEIEKYKDTRENHYTPDYKVITLTKEDGTKICVVNHSANRVTLDAFHQIGEEVIEVLPEGMSIDYVVSVLGNFTTTTAFAETLKVRYPRAKFIGLEDENNPSQFTQKFPGRFEKEYGRPPEFKGHTMYGASAKGTRLAFEETGRELLDEIVLVDDANMQRMAEWYNAGKPFVETIGNSSVASLYVARQIVNREPGSTVLIFFYDKADRYGEPIVTQPLLFLDSEIQPLDESIALQDLGWRQSTVQSPGELPRSLSEAYMKFPFAGPKRRVA